MEIIVRKLALLVTLATFAALPASAEHGLAMKIQYYTDNDCKNYAGEQMLGYGEPGDKSACKQFYISGTWTANIATCYDSKGCTCTFYTDEKCKSPTLKEYDTGYVDNGVHPNCAHNNGNGFRSYKCFVRTF